MTHTLKRLGVKAMVALGLGLGAWTSGVTQQLYWSNVQIGSLYYVISDTTVLRASLILA